VQRCDHNPVSPRFGAGGRVGQASIGQGAAVIRVMVVDDHELFRQALCAVVDQEFQ
jgi:hypothetical protein